MSDKRVVAITGASKGLGAALAKRYLEKGWAVYGCARSEAPFEREGYRHIVTDATDEKSVKAFFKTIKKERGRLDVLINNAGVESKSPAALHDYKLAENVFRVNALGVFLFSREALRMMTRARSGRIVNLSSVTVPVANVGASVYSASKAAIEQLTRALAKEAADAGVTVNALGLSIVEGTGMEERLGERAEEGILAGLAIRRKITVEEVSRALDFLLDSPAVTGETIYFGGV